MLQLSTDNNANVSCEKNESKHLVTLALKGCLFVPHSYLSGKILVSYFNMFLSLVRSF